MADANRGFMPVADEAHAPIVYFDITGSFSNHNGVVGILLAAGAFYPNQEGGADPRVLAVAHLRCSVEAAKSLRDLLDKALLLGQATEGAAN